MDTKGKLRLFVAAELPEGLRAKLADAAHIARKQSPDAPLRWLDPQNYHITLRFLGDTEPVLVDRIAAALDRVATGGRPAQIGVDGTGCFPNCRRPRVVFFRVVDSQKRLDTLHRLLQTALYELVDIAPENRSLRPHITAAYAKGQSPNDARRIAAARERLREGLPPIEASIEGLSLFRSTLGRDGAVHEPVVTRSLLHHNSGA